MSKRWVRASASIFFNLFTAINLMSTFCAESPDKTSLRSNVGRITTTALKADLDFLFKTIADVHPNMYAYIGDEEFVEHRDALYEQIRTPMNSVEFYELVAPVVAKLKNGHTFVSSWLAEFDRYTNAGGKVFPLAISWAGTEAVLRENHGLDKLPIGGTILAINGEDADEVMDRLSRYSAVECKDLNPANITRSDILPRLLWVEYGPVESWSLRIRASDGTVDDYEIRPINLAWWHYPVISRKAGESNYSYRYLTEYAAGLLEFNLFDNSEKFKTFLKEVFGDLKKRKASSLIIDLRGNPGGDSSMGDLLLDYLSREPTPQFQEFRVKLSAQALQQKPHLEELQKVYEHFFPNTCIEENGTIFLPLAELAAKLSDPSTEWRRDNPLGFEGSLFVLIGRATASSALSLASTIGAADIGTLVGEETNDTTAGYGDCLEFKMPNSGLKFMVPDAYIVVVGGKANGRGLIPHHKVRRKPEDLAAGIDTVLEYTLSLPRRRRAQAFWGSASLMSPTST